MKLFDECCKREHLSFLEVWWDYIFSEQPWELPAGESIVNKSGLRMKSVPQCTLHEQQ